MLVYAIKYEDAEGESSVNTDAYTTQEKAMAQMRKAAEEQVEEYNDNSPTGDEYQMQEDDGEVFIVNSEMVVQDTWSVYELTVE